MPCTTSTHVRERGSMSTRFRKIFCYGNEERVTNQIINIECLLEVEVRKDAIVAPFVAPIGALRSHSLAHARPCPSSRNTRFRLKPIRLHETPTWLMAICFIYLTAANFKPLWLAEAPTSTKHERVEEAPVELRLSGIIPSFSRARETLCRHRRATAPPVGQGSGRSKGQPIRAHTTVSEVC